MKEQASMHSIKLPHAKTQPPRPPIQGAPLDPEGRQHMPVTNGALTKLSATYMNLHTGRGKGALSHFSPHRTESIIPHVTTSQKADETSHHRRKPCWIQVFREQWKNYQDHNKRKVLHHFPCPLYSVAVGLPMPTFDSTAQGVPCPVS